MTVADLYKLLVISQKVIIKNRSTTIVRGFIEEIPLECLEKRIIGIETLYRENNTIIIIIE